ncbi:MFS family permease [Lipingzhangella halophila]|uniref:MFS family permease n=1 Tax=Lipingzhangella halophila TaxID=1783352 RepID=A0A7W7W518_9ACTN|nr:MFS transporter [Lipingzhangella halophila]MBB4934767.1 MFS family permease [Lipingzhangella halophila]
MLGELRAPAKAKPAAPHGWAPFVVLFLVGLVDRIEHQLMSGALPLIQADWGFSDTAAGSIATAGAVASVLVVLPAGYLTDRYPRTRIIGVVVMCWALVTLGSGLATGFAVFYALRVLLSAAQELDNPAAGSLIADYYPVRTRPKIYGWTRVTEYLGGFGAVLAGLIGEAFGWRAVFLFMAVPGLLIGLLCWWLREPARGALDAEEAGAPTRDSPGAAPTVRVPLRFGRQLRRVLTTPTLVLVAAGVCLLTFGLQGIFFWMPSMIYRTFDTGAGVAGTVTGTVTISGVLLGTLLGSWLGRRADAAFRGGRMAVAGTGVTAGALVLMFALSQQALPAFAAGLLVAVMLMSTAIPNNFASIADVVGAESRGLGFAFPQLLLTAGAAFGPMATGAVSDYSGSLVTAFLVLTVPMALAGLPLIAARWTFGRDAQRVLDDARSREG